MRAALIAVAGVLLSTLHFVIYIFGAFLIFTGIKFLREQDHQPDLERHPVVRFANRIFRTSHEYDGQKFFTRKNGLLCAATGCASVSVPPGTVFVPMNGTPR